MKHLKLTAILLITAITLALTGCGESPPGVDNRTAAPDITTAPDTTLAPPDATITPPTAPPDTTITPPVTPNTGEMRINTELLNKVGIASAQAEYSTFEGRVDDLFLDFDRIFSPIEIASNYNVKHFETSYSPMDSRYQSLFATEKHLIIVNANFEKEIRSEDEVIVQSWLEVNQGTVHNITEKELMSTKFQFLGFFRQIGTGFPAGATVEDFYNDPVIKKIMKHYDNLKIDGFSEINGRYVLKKNGIEVKNGLLEPGMTFECVERWRVTDDGHTIHSEDSILFPLIEFVKFSY
jgi:hypothetical protein